MNLKVSATLWQSEMHVPRGKLRCGWIPSDSHRLIGTATTPGEQKLTGDVP